MLSIENAIEGCVIKTAKPTQPLTVWQAEFSTQFVSVWHRRAASETGGGNFSASLHKWRAQNLRAFYEGGLDFSALDGFGRNAICWCQQHCVEMCPKRPFGAQRLSISNYILHLSTRDMFWYPCSEIYTDMQENMWARLRDSRPGACLIHTI